jgi:hypothetical protein
MLNTENTHKIRQHIVLTEETKNEIESIRNFYIALNKKMQTSEIIRKAVKNYCNRINGFSKEDTEINFLIGEVQNVAK